jgi:uncharacterized membrane protein
LPSVEAVLLGLAVSALVVLQIVVPGISLDYGLGRSFMQALMVLAPIIVTGSLIAAVGPLRRWSAALAVAIAMVFFISSTGLMPQVLGGYGAQLHLNNAGDYYDVFFLHDQEVSSMRWLKTNVIETTPKYPDVQMDTPLVNTALSIQGIFPSPGVHPAIVRRGSWVVLGELTIVRREGQIRAEGLAVRYRLDPAFFDAHKDRLFDDGTSRVYR